MPDIIGKGSGDSRQGASELFYEFVKGVTHGTLEC